MFAIGELRPSKFGKILCYKVLVLVPVYNTHPSLTLVLHEYKSACCMRGNTVVLILVHRRRVWQSDSPSRGEGGSDKPLKPLLNLSLGYLWMLWIWLIENKVNLGIQLTFVCVYIYIQVNLDMTDHCTTDFWLWRTICLVPVPCILTMCIWPCIGRIPYAGTRLPRTNITAHTMLFTM